VSLAGGEGGAMSSAPRPDRAADAVDPDLPLTVAEQRRESTWDPAVLGSIALGGIIGAEARYGMSVWLPHRAGQWPEAIWLVNISGCFLIGVLMVVITELTSPHRLVRPFLGVGILGGYTTFSTAMVEVQELALAGRGGLALGYLAATVLAALAATFLGVTLTRAIAAVRQRGRGHQPGPREQRP
jgi:fluoride exporter